MSNCAIKICRNYKGRLKSAKDISYHRIPIDPVIRNEWTVIIRKSRGEEFWKPSRHTVICSEHFSAKDLYFVKNQRRRRLKPKAVPKKALFLSSVQSEDSDEADEDNGLKTVKRDTVEVNPPVSNEEHKSIVLSDVQLSTSSVNRDDENDLQNEISDSDSIFDTPREEKLRKELRRKDILVRKHSLRIQSLRKKNIRLKKKIATFKTILERFKRHSSFLIGRCYRPKKKMQNTKYIDDDTYNFIKASNERVGELGVRRSPLPINTCNTRGIADALPAF